MCRHHAAYLYREPAASNPMGVVFALRSLHLHIVCTRCGLTGGLKHKGGVSWYTKGKVGYLSRAKRLAEAAEWNAKVEAAESTSDRPATVTPEETALLNERMSDPTFGIEFSL